MHANQIASIRETIEIAIRRGNVEGDLDELTTHAVRIAEFDRRLQWQRFPLTVTDAELAAAVDLLDRKAKRSAGARALSQKYGKAAAERIIEEKTGRSVKLQR